MAVFSVGTAGTTWSYNPTTAKVGNDVREKI